MAKKKMNGWLSSENRTAVIKRFALYTLFFIIAAFQGYRLGTGDLDTYLPFVYHEFDDSLFKGDLLMETVGVHPVYIWKAMGALLHLLPGETLFLVAFFIQIMVIMTGLVLFYREFFGFDKGVYLLLAMMSISKSSAAMGRYGLNPYKYFQPGAMAFGVFLMTVVLWNRKRWIAGGCLCGLMFLFHPFTAVTLGLTYAVLVVLQWKSVHIKNILMGGVAVVVVASPAIVPYLHHLVEKNSTVFDFSLWLEIVQRRMAHSFFISQWVSDRFVHLIAALAVIVSFRRHQAFIKVLPVVIAPVISVLMMAAGEMVSSKMLLQLQLGRTSYLVFVIMIMFIANRVVRIRFSSISVQDAIWFAVALFITVYPLVEKNIKSTVPIILTVLLILIPAALFFSARMKKPVLSKWIGFLDGNVLITVFLFFSVTATAFMLQKRYSQTGVLFDLTASDYTEIAAWVRNNIPSEEMIMTPIYLEGFRGHSSHPIYGTWKDGAPHNYCEATVFRWWERMQKFGIEISTDKSNFPRLYHEKALEIARTEAIKYVVFENEKFNAALPVLFKNKTYAIARID